MWNNEDKFKWFIDNISVVWGGFSVSSATINRFFSLHFTLPFILAALAAGHLLYLHVSGSSNPMGTTSNADRTAFHPYFVFKDLITVFLFFIIFTAIVFYTPDKLGQLWPLCFLHISLLKMCNGIMKYAICWKYSICFKHLKQIIYNKTIFISYLILFAIIIIKNKIYSKIFSLIYLNTNIVKFYYSEYNQPVTKDDNRKFRMDHWVETSETLRVQKREMFSLIKNNNKDNDYDNEIRFNQWLAGLIDGDGCFLVSQKGYTSCEITVALEDEKLLRVIQNKIGGSVKTRSGVKAIRIRFQNKKLMISLIQRVNGFIYNSVRIPQLARVCDILNIAVILPNYENIPLPWFMGFFDADGTVNFYPHFKNHIHYRNQLTISVGNKYYQNLLSFKNRFGGNIYFDKGGSGKFIWKINSKAEHLNFYSEFLSFPSKSTKSNRLFLIKEYYEFVALKAFSARVDSAIYKSWLKFVKKWNKKII